MLGASRTPQQALADTDADTIIAVILLVAVSEDCTDSTARVRVFAAVGPFQILTGYTACVADGPKPRCSMYGISIYLH